MTPKAVTTPIERVADLMSSPVLTTTPGTKATDAALVIGLRNITALPVLDEGRLVGLFTATDLLRCRPSAGQSSLLVADVMTPVSLVATPASDPTELADRMGHRDAHSVPVIESSRLVGIITANDLRGHARPAPARSAGRPL